MSPQDKDTDQQGPWMPRPQYQGGSDWANQRITNLEAKAADFETRAAELRGQLREITVRESEREERRKDQFARIAETQKEQLVRVADNQRDETARLRSEIAALREALNAMRQDNHRDMELINKKIDGVQKSMPNTTYVDLIWNTGKGAVILILGIVAVMVLNSSGISK